MRIYFMKDREINKFLEKDEDKYIDRMSKIDLKARKCTSKEGYINKIKKCGINMTEKEKERIREIMNIIKIIIKYKEYFIKENDILKYIKLNKIIDRDYKISKIDNKYEEGIPHTRENIIFLNKNIINGGKRELIRIIIHEMIHIYQRYNNMKKYLEKYEEIKREEYHRNNPDTNHKIYKKRGEKIMRYKDKNPKEIGDVENEYEHPYEEMAYKIEKIIKYKNIII